MKSAREVDAVLKGLHQVGRPADAALIEEAITEQHLRANVAEARAREHAEEVERLRAELAAAKDSRARAERRLAEFGQEEHDDLVGKLRAELAEASDLLDKALAANLEALRGRNEAQASLATVTADRDAARSDLAEARVDLAEHENRIADIMQDAAKAAKLAVENAQRAEKAEAALAASVRREDVVRWLRSRAEHWLRDANLCRDDNTRRHREWVASAVFAFAGQIENGSWLRDLATMDGRPAETGTPRVKCTGCSATYDQKWAGTTCSECDSDIGAATNG